MKLFASARRRSSPCCGWLRSLLLESNPSRFLARRRRHARALFIGYSSASCAPSLGVLDFTERLRNDHRAIIGRCQTVPDGHADF